MRADHLGALARELLRGVRASAADIAARPADLRARVERGEVVQDVEAGHADAPAHRGRGVPAWIVRRVEREGGRRLDAITAKALVEDAFDQRAQSIADADGPFGIARGQAAILRIGRRIQVLPRLTAAIVDDDAAPVVQGLQGQCRRPGVDKIGRIDEAVDGQHHLAEAAEVKGFRHRQGRCDLHGHAFVPLPFGEAGHGQGDDRAGEGVSAATDRGVRDGGQLGERGPRASELQHLPPDPHPITDLHGHAEAAVEDEDPLGRRGVAVPLALVLLHVEAVELDRPPEVGDDDALDDNRLSRHRAGRARALNVVDRRGRVTTGTEADRRGEGERHVGFEGLDGLVLIGHPGGQHGHRAGRQSGQQRRGGQYVGLGTAAEREGDAPATADDLKRGRARGHGFTERNGDNRLERDTGCAIGGVGLAHGRRHVSAAEVLVGVAGTKRVRRRGVPLKIRVRRAGAAELQGRAHRGRRGALRDADVFARQTGRGAIRGGERSLVAQKLDHGSGSVDEGEPIVRTVLEPILRIGDHHDTEASAQIGDHRPGGERLRRSGRGVDDGRPGGRAVVPDDLPVAEVRAGRSGDLHLLARVRSHVVVVNLVDEHRLALGRRRHCQQRGQQSQQRDGAFPKPPVIHRDPPFVR